METVQRCSYQNLLIESSSHLEDSGRSCGIHGCFQLFALLVMANSQFLFGHKENIVAYQVNRKTGTPLVRAGGREKLILRGAGTPSSHDSDNTPVCLALEFTGFCLNITVYYSLSTNKETWTQRDYATSFPNHTSSNGGVEMQKPRLRHHLSNCFILWELFLIYPF